jgi:hypothetical protein
VLVVPRVARTGRALHATWGAARTPGTAWRVWLRIGSKVPVWRTRTSRRDGTLTLPPRATEACVTASTLSPTGASAPSPPSCVETGGAGATRGLTYRQLVLADRPAAFWPFAGDPADAAGSHPLTLAGGAAIGGVGIEGVPDQALLLNGAGQYATSPYRADLNPRSFTLEAWARVDGGAGTARKVLIGRDTRGLTGFVVEATAANLWKVWLGHGTKSWDSVTGPAVAARRWTHLVVTCDGSGATFYVDGVRAGSVFTPFRPNTQGLLRLGVGRSGTGDPAFFFVGALDDVAIYPGPLAAARVAAHFKAARL